MNKYTLWEVVDIYGNRKALVKTENIFSNEIRNYWHGKEICLQHFGKWYDFGEFFNGGYDLDERRCTFINQKVATKEYFTSIRRRTQQC